MSNTDEIDHTQSKTFHENDVIPVESTGDSKAKTPNIDTSTTEQSVDKIIDAASNSKAKGWVHFDDEDTKKSQGDNPQMENVDLTEKVNNFSYF